MQYGLKESEIAALQKIFKKYGVSEVILFGSRAKGTYRSGSDIDLAVGGEDVDLNKILDLLVDIDELYLPYRVDIVNLSTISNAQLRKHIERVGKAFLQYAPNENLI